MQKLIVTGATGLVGSRFVEIASKNFSITTIGRSNVDIKIDLTSKEKILTTIPSLNADVVINFAAYTKVDEAENERGDKAGEVYTLNALLPLWLSQACRTSNKTFYHISTDYVFGGRQNNRPYKEDDHPQPVNSWYSKTKYYGEENVLKSGGSFAIIRISYPYSGVYQRKLDVARTLVEKLKAKEPYLAVKNQKIKPTSVDDIAKALIFLLNKNAAGIYHVAGNYSPKNYITPYQFAQKIARVMDLDVSLIKGVSFLSLSKKRVAPRPQHTWLSTKKIESLGFQITNIDEALERFKRQLENQPS